MATIRKRGDRYQVQVRRLGFQSTSRSFTHLKDAREWARIQELRVDRAELAGDQRPLKSTTLGQLVLRYRDTVVPLLRSARKEAVILDAFLRHPISRKTLAELTTADFSAYRDQRLRTIKPSTLKRQLVPIARMFRVASDEWGLSINSPLKKLRLVAADNRRERRLLPGEWEMLQRAARGSRNGTIALLVAFALETAMRRGEMLALRWSEVDQQRRSATIAMAKNGHSRVIPLSRAALEVLAQLHRREDEGDGPVFNISENAAKLAWQRLVKRAGIADLRFHDLRHEAISRLFERGLTPPEVASISGHRTLSQLSRYAHASSAAIRAKLDATDVSS